MKCDIHEEKDIILVCTECDNTLVCSDCIVKIHNGHKVTSIEIFAGTATDKLKDWQRQYRTLSSQCQDIGTAISTEKERHTGKVQEIETAIRSDETALHKYVTEATADLLKKCKVESNSNIDAINCEDNFFKTQLISFQNSETRLKNALREENKMKIVSLYKALERPPSDIRPCITFPGVLEYARPHLNYDKVRNILGNVTNIAFDEETGSDLMGSLRIGAPQGMNLSESVTAGSDFAGFLTRTQNILSSFRCTEDGVVCIQALSKDDCLVKTQKETEVQLVHRDGVVKKTVKFSSKYVTGITSTASGKIIVTTQQPNSVMAFQLPRDTLTLLFDTHEWTPRYLCMTPSDEILVTLKNTAGMRSVVKKYSLSGEELLSAEFDEENNALFKDPWRIRISKNKKTIAVLDQLIPGKLKCIVLLDASLKLRLRYLGHGRILYGSQNLETFHSDEGYYANDMLFDDNENMVVCEGFSKALHLLSPDCTYLRKMTQFDHSPWSLARFCKDELWVGFKDGRVKIYSGY